MYAETRTSRTPDLRLSGALSLVAHGLLLLLVGAAVTDSRARFTPPALQTIRLEVDLPPAPVAAENSPVTPSASVVEAAVPQSSDAPRPVLTPRQEERLAPFAAPQEMAAAAPDSVATLTVPAGGVTTFVTTETTTKNIFGSGDMLASTPTPAWPGILPASTHPGSGREKAISLHRELKPLYPLGARQRGEEGTVVLETTVTPNGRASNIALITSSGFQELDRAATRAVERAAFNPATEDGRTVEARARLTIVFRLTN